MSDPLVEAFRTRPHSSGWVLPTVGGQRRAHVYKIVEGVATRAGIKDAHPHKFRATF
jgi:hypothetical protein